MAAAMSRLIGRMAGLVGVRAVNSCLLARLRTGAGGCVLAADLRHRHARLAFLEDRHDLALRELALPHRPLPSAWAAFSDFSCLLGGGAYAQK